MKKIVLLLAIVALGSQAAYAYFGITPASGVTPAKSQETKTEQVIKEEGLQSVVPTSITKEEFLKLTPKKIKEATGKKLTIKEAIGLKMAQKAIKKQDGEDFPKGLYIVLAIFGWAWVLMGIMDDWSGSTWWVNLLLNFLCFIPGLIHAFVVMKKYYS